MTKVTQEKNVLKYHNVLLDKLNEWMDDELNDREELKICSLPSFSLSRPEFYKIQKNVTIGRK